MTVKELIALLSTFPPDAIVIRTFMSDYDDVEVDQIVLLTPDVEQPSWQIERYGKYLGVCRHKGHLMDVYEKFIGRWGNYPTPPDCVPVVAVHFDGN